MSTPEQDNRKRVLVIEDDQAFRELLVFGLSAAGYEVYVAENGARAVEIIGGADPDLVLLDLLMPVMDGLRFLRWLKDDSGITVPTLVVTCLDEKSSIIDALVAGASDVLIKPVTLDDLLDKMDTLV